LDDAQHTRARRQTQRHTHSFFRERERWREGERERVEREIETRVLTNHVKLYGKADGTLPKKEVGKES
jgi:hypothetical protein